MQRRLTTILAADVVGYSRLMAVDEAGTLAALKSHRKNLIDPKASQYRGRTIKLMGEGTLMEFVSVVDAVAFAVEVQCAMRERNAAIPEDRRIAYRVGINIGDIIVEGDDIYGDGVNISARLEGLADAGGICISQAVHSQIKGKLDLEYEDLGEKEVKNIPEPVTVYRIVLDDKAVSLVTPVTEDQAASRRHWWPTAATVVAGLVLAGSIALWRQPWKIEVEPASVARMAFPLPGKPSIAVLPFTNMSGDPEQEYFADGMAEDLITDLSRISGLFVIARNSSFVYKGRSVVVSQVAEELGVRYVLEGSVRRAGDEVRINAQLIDATTGGHLWAERYDGTLEDIFALQDQVTQQIVNSLAVKLTPGEADQLGELGTTNVDAHDTFLKGWSLYKQQTPSAFVEAIGHLENAVELDPKYGHAYAALAALFRDAHELRWGSQMGYLTDRLWWKSNRYLDQALNSPTPLAYVLNAYRLRIAHRHELAIAEARKAIALDPNDPNGYVGVGWELIFAGQPETAVPLIEKANRVDPLNARQYASALGLAMFGMERFDEAASWFEDSVNAFPDRYPLWALLAATRGHLGDSNEAARAIDQLHKEWLNLRSGPFQVRSVMSYFARQTYKRQSDLERIAGGLRKAGLPE